MVRRDPVVLLNSGSGTPFFRWANSLALITIIYNIAEGLVSVFFGFEDSAVSLFGFGIDSFAEVISGVGIWHMIKRMRARGGEGPDTFERRALRATGGAFYLLAAGLGITVAANLYYGYRPKTTFWGVVVALISIVSMSVLIHYKVKIGRRYNSRALLADAACTKTCLYLSIVLLVASVGYEISGIGLLDSAGAAGIAFFSIREGREAFGKARGGVCRCGESCG